MRFERPAGRASSLALSCFELPNKSLWAVSNQRSSSKIGCRPSTALTRNSRRPVPANHPPFPVPVATFIRRCGAWIFDSGTRASPCTREKKKWADRSTTVAARSPRGTSIAPWSWMLLVRAALAAFALRFVIGRPSSPFPVPFPCALCQSHFRPWDTLFAGQP
jgi:hypothetical protein